MIFVNFKTYEGGTGENAISLVRILETVSAESGIKIIPVVQSTDVREITALTKLPVWGQNIDPAEYGAHTGSTLAEALVEDGAEGTFLNHSEHKFNTQDMLKKAVERAKEAGLKTLVFATDLSELRLILRLKPTYVAYEPSELVGSKTTSVSESKPEVIKEAVEIAKKHNLPLIVGAGIKSSKDIKTALSLGATGFAVASAIVEADDPKTELLKLVEGYK
ncbi:hypothetical protein A2125_02120 [Candidatus Woesebacteria bacterium GWB1_43_5]|uniref:Uncharacterized protein n=1 Tax=Candidatus Woesebacteria bacterium GWB1_43_5 TaxID=1802474 RepID=A0A1F7WRJ7_9BACT|nr:MAG: hypothetical protein A2125_02120 [Candidatus Woesebacteria bacterium GWB1_43_5]